MRAQGPAGSARDRARTHDGRDRARSTWSAAAVARGQTAGAAAEDAFAELARRHGYAWRRASREQERVGHFDGTLTNDANQRFRVEIKAAKRRHRHARRTDPAVVVLEYTAINGSPGWLHGQATHVAFARGDAPLRDGFLVVPRAALLAYYESLRPTAPWAERSGTLFARYRRHDRPLEEVMSVPAAACSALDGAFLFVGS